MNKKEFGIEFIWSCNNLAREYFKTTKSDELDKDTESKIIELVKSALKEIDPETGDFKLEPVCLETIPFVKE